jgi:hypothetical protein
MGFSHFITLTDHRGDKVRINVGSIVKYSSIKSFPKSEYYTEMFLTGSHLTVKETPELIDTYLRESYCTVKERHEQASYGSTTSANTQSNNTNLGLSNSGHEGSEPRGDSEVRDSSSS